MFVFSTYIPVFLLKFQSGELVGCEIWFRIQRVPTLHTFDRPRYPKNNKYLKKCDDEPSKEIRKLARPCRLWSCLSVRGEGRSKMAWTFSGSTVIPLWETMKPNNRPAEMQKTHLCGFKWIWYLRQRRKTCRRSCRWSDRLRERAVRSSRYTSRMWTKSWKQ